ncbi:MAG: hypothetical protein AB1847_19685 [bacterium]
MKKSDIRFATISEDRGRPLVIYIDQRGGNYDEVRVESSIEPGSLNAAW